MITFLYDKQVAVKGYEDGRVESDDRNICFYPYKSKLNDEKLKAINSDESGIYLAVANQKGKVNVFEVDKLYNEHSDKVYCSF